jgi:hemoglobin
MTEVQRTTVYQQVGGMPVFLRLAKAFYARVDRDPLLRPMFVEPTLDGPAERLGMFLAQYFGGPPNYSLQRGHPRLRMRHMPFVIGKEERDAWVGHMLEAIDETGIAEPMRTIMRDYIQDAATFLMNKPVMPE